MEGTFEIGKMTALDRLLDEMMITVGDNASLPIPAA